MVRIRSTAKPRHGLMVLLVDLSKVVLETCLSVFLLVVPSVTRPFSRHYSATELPNHGQEFFFIVRTFVRYPQ